MDHFVWSRRSGNGQDPVLHTSFPFVGAQAIYVGEGMGYLLPWVYHNWVWGIHELVKVKFVEEMIGLLSVSIKDGGFFPLEWFFILSDQVWVLRESWWRSQRWCWRRWSSEQFL